MPACNTIKVKFSSSAEELCSASLKVSPRLPAQNSQVPPPASMAAYTPPLTLGSLKDYVKGQSHMQQAAESTVVVSMTHNHLKARFPEIRLDLHVGGKARRIT